MASVCGVICVEQQTKQLPAGALYYQNNNLGMFATWKETQLYQNCVRTLKLVIQYQVLQMDNNLDTHTITKYKESKIGSLQYDAMLVNVACQR